MAAMSGPASSSSGVDLSRLPAPTIVATLSFEAILAALVEQLQAVLPEFDAIVESDPVMKILQVAAYRELLLRGAVNDAGKQVMTAYAAGANLDHLAALVAVSRLVLDPGDPDAGIPPTLESDADLRQRIVLAPEGFSVAGPELAYVYHAKSASGEVLDASATSPEPGEVLVSVLARAGDGAADADLLATVEAVVNSRAIRPLGDLVTVASAQIVDFAIDATLYTYAGPDSALVLQSARDQLDAYLARHRRLGRDIPRSGVIAALTVEGIQRVVLTAPAADVVCDPTQAAWCTGIVTAHGGHAD